MLKTAIIAGAVAAIGFPLIATATPANADPKHNVILGTSGDDNLVGTKKSDFIFGFQGNDTLTGNEKGDALLGGFGDDTLYAAGKHSGTDVARGGPGTDTCYVDATDRTIGCEIIIVQ